MDKLFKILNRKPELFEQTDRNIWEDDYVSKGMLEAHLDENFEAATRRIDFVKESVEWISTILPPIRYPQLLDLGCGPGIYTSLFREKGYQVTGIDLSPRSISYAKNKAKQHLMNIDYQLADYTKMILDCKYHLVTLIYCDFGVLPFQVRKELLKKIYDALLPSGVMLFDVFKPLKYEGMKETHQWEIGEKTFWHEETSLILQSFFRYEEDHTFLNRYTIVTKDQQILNYHVWEHTFILEEIKKDLLEAGFKDIQFYGDVCGHTLEENMETMCVIARK